MSAYESPWPVHLDPKNLTMPKKLIISVAPTGSQITRAQNPQQPYNHDEVAKEVIAAYNEGASCVHVHCRTGMGDPDYRAESYKQTLDLIFDSCPDIIAMPTTVGHGDSRSIKDLVEALRGYGKKYIRSTILLEANMRDLAAHLEHNHIKPEFTCRSLEDIRKVDEVLIKPGMVIPPYFLTVSPGMKGSGYTHVEPWATLAFISMRYSLPPTSVVSVSTGGRNWLGLANLAILLGAECIRIGMEDTTWLYPDRDELLAGNALAVRKVAAIARELGREIATPQDVVGTLGLN